jgi:hypothetical protein
VRPAEPAVPADRRNGLLPAREPACSAPQGDIPARRARTRGEVRQTDRERGKGRASRRNEQHRYSRRVGTTACREGVCVKRSPVGEGEGQRTTAKCLNPSPVAAAIGSLAPDGQRSWSG